MPAQLASLDSLVHPHQIEVQEFSSYALVIDARSAEAFREDHIPGAVNVPVRMTGEAVPGSDESAASLREGGQAIPYALSLHTHKLAPSEAVLVYCDRGGLDSLVWAEPLRAAGFRVDVLGGGWINYRRWVSAGLEVLPRALTFRRLCAPPVSGLCQVMHRLATLGEQVLDLPIMVGQRLIPGLSLGGEVAPSQDAFETALLDAMRRFDPRRPVWVREGSRDLGGLQLPPALRGVLSRARGLWIEVPLTVRVQAWFAHMQATGVDMAALLQAIAGSAKPPALGIMKQWRSLASSGRGIDAVAEIVKGFVDPHALAARRPIDGDCVRMTSLESDDVAAEVERWRAAQA